MAHVLLKDETSRFGLPSFKILGASWAVRRLAGEMLGVAEDMPLGLAQLGPGLQRRGVRALVTATDGNHGRAVARVARIMGLEARIVVPAGTARARVEAIEAEGAAVEEVAGSHADAVARSRELADGRHLLVSDTSWPGYESVPGWVVEGYGTIFHEIDQQLAGAPLDVVLIPAGVGSLAAAAVRHFRATERAGDSVLVTVEPHGAACLLESVRAGRPVDVPGPHRSIMAGLNCDTPSPAVWPELQAGVDLAMSIDDALAVDGMRRLRDLGIAGGECAGGAVGAAVELLTGEGRASARARADASVLILLTEGVTDPETYEGAVGSR